MTVDVMEVLSALPRVYRPTLCVHDTTLFTHAYHCVLGPRPQEVDVLTTAVQRDRLRRAQELHTKR